MVDLAGARQGRKNGGLDRFIVWIGTVGSRNAGLYFIDNTLGCIHLIETGGRTAMKWATRSHRRQMRYNKRQWTNSNWHRWFAWYPVLIAIEGTPDYWVWFEYIERKWKRAAYSGEGSWRYRRAGSRALGEQPLERLPAQPANSNQEPSRRYSGL